MADEEKIILSLEAEDNASQKVDKVTKSVRDLGEETDKTNSKSIDLSGIASKLESGIHKINNVTRNYNAAMGSFNRAVIRGVEDMGSAIYDFTSDSISNFTNFSEQHAKTLGAMAADYDNTAESQRKFFEDAQKLKSQAVQLGTFGVNGTGTLTDVVGVSEMQTELVKAGISSDDIVGTNVTADVLKFAQANELNTEQAVEFAVTLGNQFGIDKSEWGSMLDKVSHTADMSIIDVKDIIQSMKWAGGITAGLDRDFEETLGMISILGNFGLKGSQGGTGIQALMTRLLTGDTTVITQAQAEVAPGNALEKFYQFEKIAKPDGNLLPMPEVIDEMDAIMADMTDEEQAWFAKKLFGLYQMKSAYALLNGDETDLADVIKEIKEQSEGTNDNKLSQLLASQYGQLASLNYLWEGIKTDVGDRLSPFVSAVREELFNFLKNDGNYDINFDNLKSALDESCDLIEERYGSAIADAVRNFGGLTIDLSQVMAEVGPELGDGLLSVINSLLDGDIFGDGGVFDNWETMIGNMHESANGLPEDLRDLGDAVVDTVDWFGKLITLNIASELTELISSALQIFTVLGSMVVTASTVIVSGPTAGGTGTGIGGGGLGGKKITGSTKVGSADDVAKSIGMTTDDVIKGLGKKSSYTVDDIAKGFGTTTDEVITAFGKTNGLWGSLSKIGKGLGIAGTAVQIGSSGVEAYQGFKAGDTQAGAEAIGGGAGALAGGWGGAKAGAALGTLVAPGAGTAVGTLLGAIIGSIGGDKLARGIVGGAFDDNVKGAYKSDHSTIYGANDTISSNNVTINAANASMNGELSIPKVAQTIPQLALPKLLPSFDNTNKLINNQIQIDDSVTMQPQFNVAAPNVNVDVTVDRYDRITKDVSILNPNQDPLLNSWYRRTSSRFGRTTR